MIRDAFGGTGTLEGGVFKPYADQAEADAATAAKPEKVEADDKAKAKK